MSDPTQSNGADGGPVDGDEALSPEDRQRAQRILLIFARAGAAVSEALHSRLGPEYGSNVEVLVITSLDLLGPQRPADVVALTGMTSGGVTRVLDRLEEQGLMVREFGRVEGDRRGTRLVLTPKGHGVATELAAGLTSRMDVIREAIAELLDMTTT
jgi:DNA-binding MarR family transcriptional regulator